MTPDSPSDMHLTLGGLICGLVCLAAVFAAGWTVVWIDRRRARNADRGDGDPG